MGLYGKMRTALLLNSFQEIVVNWRKQRTKRKKWSKIEKKTCASSSSEQNVERGGRERGWWKRRRTTEGLTTTSSTNQRRCLNCFYADAEVAGESTRLSGWYKKRSWRAVKSLSPVIHPDANTTANHDGTYERVSSCSSLCRPLPCWRYFVNYFLSLSDFVVD